MRRSLRGWMLILALAWPAAGTALGDGARLYERYCAACQGRDGKGGVGVPLALTAFQSTVSDRYLESTIRTGRPGRVMPAFSSLSDDEVLAIVRHIRSWYQGAVPADSREPVAGKTFSRPRDLPIMAPALNNPGFLATASDTMIRETLTQGREGTLMPLFSKQGLTHQDIDDIVSFIRAFESSLYPEGNLVPCHKGGPS